MPKSPKKANSLTANQINKILSRCQLMQNAELKRAALVLSLSTLRVSELAQITIAMNVAGVPLETIQRALGYKEPSMSIEYIDVYESQLIKASELAF